MAKYIEVCLTCVIVKKHNSILVHALHVHTNTGKEEVTGKDLDKLTDDVLLDPDSEENDPE